MLEALRRSQRPIMWVVILGVGLVFVVFVGAGGPTGGSTSNVVVEVDGLEFDPRDVSRIRSRQEARYREVLGDAYDDSAAGAQLDQIAVSILASQALRAKEAERLGLTVDDAEIRDFVRSNLPGATDESGRLRPDTLRNYAEGEYGTESHFVELLRMDLLARKLDQLFRESLTVTDLEARESLLHGQEEVRIAYVALDTKTPRGDVEVSDSDVDGLLAENEARVRDLYERRADQYEQEEGVRARHILFQVAEDAAEEDVASARLRAEEALGRLRSGEDFGALAAEVSDDVGTKDLGGELGFLERTGPEASELRDAVFVLEVGAVSDPVRSGSGFHLLRVEERRPARVVPFEEVRRDLAREIFREQQIAHQARVVAERLASAIGEGQSLVDAAREEGLTLERTDPLRRRPDGYVTGLGAATEVMTVAFTLAEDRPASRRIFTVGDRLVLIELLERTRPAEEEIQAQLESERERLQQAQLTLLPQAWLEDRRAELTAAGKIRYDLKRLNPCG